MSRWLLRFIETPSRTPTGSGTARPGRPSPRPGRAPIVYTSVAVPLVECSKPFSVHDWRYAYGEMP